MNGVTYLDYAATTPLDPRVAEAMSEVLAAPPGNASSLHLPGRRAAARIATAREQVAALIGAAPECLIFTSGATESNNLAILGCAAAARRAGDARNHLVSLRIEHRSVLDPLRQLERDGWRVTLLTPQADGLLDLATLRAAITPATLLVSVQHANNETGVVQDLAAIAALCRELGAALHVDAAQSAGKLPLDVCRLGVQLLSFCAHKLCGPQGVGALYVAAEMRARLQPLQFGGGQERGLRSGTLPTHLIVGFGVACMLALREGAADARRAVEMRNRLRHGLSLLPGVLLNGHPTQRLPGILNLSFEDVEGESLFAGLQAELAVSTGSACSSATGEPSYVLRALGRDDQLAQSSVRFSFGRFSTKFEIDRALLAVNREINRLRDLSPDAMAPISSAAQARTGEAGSRGLGTWVRWQLGVGIDGVVKDARFAVYGCPHTEAVCAWLAPQVAGRTILEAVPGAPQQWAQALQVPVEKLGRLLVIEDALRACL